jgi:hypothetical protein
MSIPRITILLALLAVVGLGAGGISCSGNEDCIPAMSFEKAGNSGFCGCNDDGDCPDNQVCEFGLCGCVTLACNDDSDCGPSDNCENNCCLLSAN